jgi:hypothetical protein
MDHLRRHPASISISFWIFWILRLFVASLFLFLLDSPYIFMVDTFRGCSLIYNVGCVALVLSNRVNCT